ncbi:MAG: hypothetical protein L3K16_05790, partial [Thermoplasmata archaeon]|nr:hypothetical protein [Thermoplasmata archaeon]
MLGRQPERRVSAERCGPRSELEAWFQTWATENGYRANHPETFHYGHNNRMMTVNLQYPTTSATTGLIKVQLNFEDPLLFPIAAARARSLLTGPVPAKFLLLDGTLATEYATPVPVIAYDPREILGACGAAPNPPRGSSIVV